MSNFELIHMSFANIFLYKGVTIDWHNYLGPTILRRNTDDERNYRNISLRIWGIVNQFSLLADEEREKFRII